MSNYKPGAKPLRAAKKSTLVVREIVNLTNRSWSVYGVTGELIEIEPTKLALVAGEDGALPPPPKYIYYAVDHSTPEEILDILRSDERYQSMLASVNYYGDSKDGQKICKVRSNESGLSLAPYMGYTEVLIGVTIN